MKEPTWETVINFPPLGGVLGVRATFLLFAMAERQNRSEAPEVASQKARQEGAMCVFVEWGATE